MHEALITAAIAGLALAAVSGPLGCVIVWRRMAYFGDAMAHAALLGVAFSLLFPQLPLPLLVFVVAALSALLMRLLTRDSRLYADTALGMISHGALALGIVLIALFGSATMELEAYLLGDILALSRADALWMAALAAAVCVLIARHWKSLVMLVIDPATARLHGVAIERVEMVMVLALSALVALAIQLVGVLLLSAMLIMPAAAAGHIARAPGRMAMMACGFGMASVGFGLGAAVLLDVPPAPAMVCVASALYVVARLAGRR